MKREHYDRKRWAIPIAVVVLILLAVLIWIEYGSMEAEILGLRRELRRQRDRASILQMQLGDCQKKRGEILSDRGDQAPSWPRPKSLELSEAGLDDAFTNIQKQFYPTAKANTHENAYHHMLKIRSLQPKGLVHGHIGFFPIQAFKYYWIARKLTIDYLGSGKSFPVVCEVGFGTGMSSSIFLTATSDSHSTKIGAPYYLFDCQSCQGDAKSEALEYLKGVFPNRIRLQDGLSGDTLPAFYLSHTDTACDIISIDGSHTYPDVLYDIRHAAKLAHKDTIVLFDDYQNGQVKRSIDEAVSEGTIAIKEIFTADYNLDLIMSSIGSQKQYKKIFVQASFVQS